MKMTFDITKPCYSEQILPVPWPFVISRFHCQQLREVIKLIRIWDYIIYIDICNYLLVEA